MSHTADRMASARAHLRSAFGFDDFKPGQEEVVRAVLDDEHVLAIMPTGSGKSLCFQLPALVREGLTVVVSPLIALMRDQVAALHQHGIAAGCLNSANSAAENRRIAELAGRGELRLLYAAPERLCTPQTMGLLQSAGVALLAVDEAHCVSQWGHDFRPEYLRIGNLVEYLGGVQILALTATADAATRSDIADKLFADRPRVFVHGFDRPNLTLAMRPKADGRRQLLRFIADHRGESGIVYCRTRKRTEELASLLTEDGHRALPYHAGMEKEKRAANQDVFINEDGVIVVATIAFGMGIDKPDVRFVCHADLPRNIEGYYQEIGRAGRDGLPTDTLTFYGLDDIRLHRFQIEDGNAPEEQKRIERQRLNALVALCEAPCCRRQTLLAYFGESTEPCGNCDLCLDGVDTVDGTMAAQKAMSAMVRTGQRFATEHLVNLLLGEENERILQFNHHTLPTFGVGKEHTRNEWRSIFRQLYAAEHISMDIVHYGRWSLTESGWRILRGQDTFHMRKDVLQPRTKKKKKSEKAPVALSDADAPLLARLKDLRRDLARARDVPAYVIFPDRTLEELAAARPASLDAMRGIHGIGEVKLERFGEAFLEAITKESGP